MKPEHYQNLKIFLEIAEYPSSLSPTQKKQLKRKNKYFCIKNNQLYKRNQKKQTTKKLLKVIQKHEVKAILYLIHNHLTGTYFRTDKMFDKLKDNIFGLKYLNIFKTI